MDSSENSRKLHFWLSSVTGILNEREVDHCTLWTALCYCCHRAECAVCPCDPLPRPVICLCCLYSWQVALFTDTADTQCSVHLERMSFEGLQGRYVKSANSKLSEGSRSCTKKTAVTNWRTEHTNCVRERIRKPERTLLPSTPPLLNSPDILWAPEVSCWTYCELISSKMPV